MSVKTKLIAAKDHTLNYIEENKGLILASVVAGLFIVARIHSNEINKLEERVTELEEHPDFFVKNEDGPGYRKVKMNYIDPVN